MAKFGKWLRLFVIVMFVVPVAFVVTACGSNDKKGGSNDCDCDDTCLICDGDCEDCDCEDDEE